jgi:PAS domain S-box-containing protein
MRDCMIRDRAVPSPRRRGLLLGALLAGLPASRAVAAEAPALPARAMADAIGAELRRVETTLQAALAGLETRPPPLAALDRAARGGALALGLNVVALDGRLAQLVNAEVPPGTPLPASPAAELAADALEGGRPALGVVEAPDGARLLGLAVPSGSGRGGIVLVALLPPAHLAALLAAAPGAERIAAARLVAQPEGRPEQLLAESQAAAPPPDAVAATQPLARDGRFAVTVLAAPPAAVSPARDRMWPALTVVSLGIAGAALLLRRRRPVAPDTDARRALGELRAICDTIPVGLALLDRNAVLLSANRRVAAFVGLPAEFLVGRAAGDVLPPALAEAIESAHAGVLRDGRAVLDRPCAVEAAGMLRHTRELLVSCHPVGGEAGAIQAVSVAIQDVTERSRAEAGRDLLVRELNHRVKNVLATVQTIAQQTLRSAAGDPGSFAQGFGERLRALARAHDLLTAHAWGEAEMAAVTRTALSPWLEDPRLRLDAGPPVLLRPSQAQALVLAFHELATNAAKHGALTRDGGEVRLRWSQDGSGLVTLTWRESGGPPILAPPERRGFGTRLLAQALRQDLGTGATADLAFEPQGLAATVRFRAGVLAAEPVAA